MAETIEAYDAQGVRHRPVWGDHGEVKGCICGTTRNVSLTLDDNPVTMEMHSSFASLLSAMGRDSVYSVFREAPNGEYWKDTEVREMVVILHDGERYYCIPPAW